MAEPASVDPAVSAQAYLPRVVRPEGKAGREQPKQAAHNTEANKMAARKANNAENPSKKDSREANKKARKKHPAKMKQQKGQKRRPAKMNSRKAGKKADQKTGVLKRGSWKEYLFIEHTRPSSWVECWDGWAARADKPLIMGGVLR